MQELKRQLDPRSREVSRAPSKTLSNPEGLDSLSNPWSGRQPPRKTGRYATDLTNSAKFWWRSWRLPFAGGGGISSDLLAGTTVAAVALPLNVALAVACGLPASAGIIAGAVGGLLAALFGGSIYQVTGPAAALNVLVLALVATYGAAGAVAGALAVGITQILLFFMRAGSLMRFVPEAVLAGFTTGVGLKLLDQQIPLLIDVNLPVTALLSTIHAPVWLNDVHWLAVVSGLLVIVFVQGLAKYKRFPAAIVGISMATLLSMYLNWNVKKVGSIPAEFPFFAWPDLPSDQWASLFFACIPLAILATAESLLSAKAADRMAKADETKQHDPNLESFGQGLANVGAGLFGGMPVSGVIVRSSVNVQSGARSRLSAAFHAFLLLMAPVMAAHLIAEIPIAALAGLLCIVGYRLVEVSTLLHIFKDSKLQAVAFMVSAAGVVTGRLTLGLVLAMVLAGFSVWYRGRQAKAKQKDQARTSPALPAGVRALIPATKTDHFFRAKQTSFRSPEENWESHINHEPVIHPTAFVHPNASVIGRVVLAPGVHVAAEAALRADEGTPFFIGNHTNIQDGVVLHALKQKWVQVGDRKWAIHIGERVSMAHQALIHGPCAIGDDTFIGFKAVIHDSVVGSHCFIGIGAIVVGVEIPDGRLVPHGTLVDTAEKAQALPLAQPSHHHFNEDVVEVNLGLAEAYRGKWMEAPSIIEELPSPLPQRIQNF